MTESYKSVHKYGEDEIIIDKSRFIGYCKPVETEEEAIGFVEDIKSIHKTATHNCYAYIIGKNIQRFSDDGEPSHTAGMPILTTLINEELQNLCVVVTRYFGGILLGKGGLVRAYTAGCKIALDNALVVDKVLHYKVKLKLDYTNLGIIENYLIGNGVDIVEKIFLQDVDIIIYISVDKHQSLIDDLLELTSGNIHNEIIDEEYLSVLNGKILF